jgi:hypothetical protein
VFVFISVTICRSRCWHWKGKGLISWRRLSALFAHRFLLVFVVYFSLRTSSCSCSTITLPVYGISFSSETGHISLEPLLWLVPEDLHWSSDCRSHYISSVHFPSSHSFTLLCYNITKSVSVVNIDTKRLASAWSTSNFQYLLPLPRAIKSVYCDAHSCAAAFPALLES